MGRCLFRSQALEVGGPDDSRNSRKVSQTKSRFINGYPLVNIQKAIENGPVEIVDFPINSMVIFQLAMLNYHL